jgi:hypothetical protein
MTAGSHAVALTCTPPSDPAGAVVFARSRWATSGWL